MRWSAPKPNIEMSEVEEEPPLGAPPADPQRVVGDAARAGERHERDTVEAGLKNETGLRARERARSHRPREQHFDIAARNLGHRRSSRSGSWASRAQTALAD